MMDWHKLNCSRIPVIEVWLLEFTWIGQYLVPAITSMCSWPISTATHASHSSSCEGSLLSEMERLSRRIQGPWLKKRDSSFAQLRKLLLCSALLCLVSCFLRNQLVCKFCCQSIVNLYQQYLLLKLEKYVKLLEDFSIVNVSFKIEKFEMVQI